MEYRRNQLKRLQEEVLDLEDMDSGVNIMDLGLNEFRMDLLAYIKKHPNIEHAPNGMNAVVRNDATAPAGVMFVLRNRNKGVNVDKINLLHPFYLVYLTDDGSVVCDYLHPKQLLDTMRHLCKDHEVPDKALCEAFNKDTADGRRMAHYSELLHQAVDSIISVKEEKAIDSLFTQGETTALQDVVKGLDDFELISFLVIR